MRLEWGLGGANHIIAVRTLIVRAVLDVRFAGPDFVDGKADRESLVGASRNAASAKRLRTAL